MRLTRLMLHAFGPFTEMELDLNGEEARPSGGLHLIYGPNEAGKSATLRALTDLRFGIPVRSTDNFIHPYGEMCIAGIFETAEGERVGLRRTKGRKNTLTKFAPSTIDGAPAGTEWETALTGALSRNDFEAMYGLNHARLREGGDRLIKGEGELGSALFEASAGTRGIGAILSRLDEDARNLFSQRAKNAVVNEARRALEEHRKNFKEAITRPREWEEVNRSNEQAQEGLAKVDNALEDTIRRQRDLTELRTVAPMLLELDQVRSELEEAKDAPELPEDARQRRLSAEQARHRANADLLQADADIAACIEALAGLNIETHLLERAEAIERLSNRVDAVESARVTIRQLESEIEQDASSLQLEAGRIAPSQDPATVLAAIPSAAERVQLDEHLAAITKLTERLAGDQERVQALSEAAAMEDADFPPPPSSKLREDLTDTMRHARGLGDTVQRHNDLRREHFQVEGELSQVLRDLGVDSIEALRASRPLMDAQISDARATRTALDQAKRECHLEQQRLREDTDKQRQRQGELAAQGEVVTAETVALARQHRDTGWRLIRQAYAQWGADKSFVSEGYDPKQPLLDAFEEAQRDADRKADLLRADTSRAANYADCTQRIDQMLRRQKALENELGSLSADGQANTGDWVCLLLESSLPELTPDALREWQAERKRGLSLAGRVNVLAQQTETLIKAEQAACDAIAAALRALGEPPRTTALSEFVDHAARWADADTKLAGKRQERARVIEKRRDDQEQLTARIAKHTVELGEHQTLASKWRGVLYLSPDSSFTSVKARLDELDALNKQAQALSHVRRELRGHQALVGEFNDQVKQMAELLGDTNPQLATEYASRLQVRLSSSRQQEQERVTQNRDQRRSQGARKQFVRELQEQKNELSKLCALAQVATVEGLSDVEDRAAEKHRCLSRLATLSAQLNRSTNRTEDELRQRLADQDVVAIEADYERGETMLARLKDAQAEARVDEEKARRALEAIDSSDTAAWEREAMESAAARTRSAVLPWARLRLAHALLQDALRSFRERAQGPMVEAATRYFAAMTDGRYPRLIAEEDSDRPILVAVREDEKRIKLDEMSEGTADQLYLALRLAALGLQRASHPHMPLVLDDVLITSDDHRATSTLRALARFAQDSQVLVFTHHEHLLDVAAKALAAKDYQAYRL